MSQLEAIELRDARVVLGGREVLRIENFRIERGVHTAITGANGSGKSTLLRVLAGRIWPESFDSRTYRFVDRETSSPIRAREIVAWLSPELQEQYVRQSQGGADNERGWELSVRTCVLTGFFDSQLLHQTPSEAQTARADSLLTEFGLADLANRLLTSLSQGQLRRVLIARALAGAPQWLFVDEACSGLDEIARDEVLKELQRLASRGEITLVMTSHRARELVPAIQSVWEMRDGAPHRATIPMAIDETVRVPVANPKRLVDEANSLDKRFVDEIDSLIELKNVSVFIDGAPILQSMNWRWPRGAHLAIRGANGSGKSTFLRLLCGKLAPAKGGEIVRFGSNKTRPIWEIARDVALVSPQLQARFRDEMSVETAVSTGFFDAFSLWRALDEREIAARENWIQRLDLESLRHRTFGRLSYGQTRRVLLARALVTNPKIVLLDEALDGFDFDSREVIDELLAELVRKGVHFAFASHHSEDFPSWCNTRLHFVDGKLATDDTD